jgi:hypothetical protein
LDVAVCKLEEQWTPSSQEAKKVSDKASVWVPGKAFPEEPIDFEDIDDPDLKRVCKKLLKMLSHDPWNEFKRVVPGLRGFFVTFCNIFYVRGLYVPFM